MTADSENDLVHEGDDVVAADDAVAEIEHFDGSVTRLDAGSRASLGRLADPDGRPHVIVRLGPGAAWHRTGPFPGRHGQYEAHASVAVVMARTATFVTRCDDDGSAWFAALEGTVVVRPRDGGTVVLQAGEVVTAAADGTVGEVRRPGTDELGEDEWVAVNAALDDPGPSVAPPPVPAAPASPPAAQPQPMPATESVSEPEPAVVATVRDDHPWRIGVAAVLAIGLGIFSVVIGRSSSRPPTAGDDTSAIGVPGPPAFSGPALTAPSVELASPTVEPAAPSTTVAPAAPRYEVTGRSCHRRNGAIAYTGTVVNGDDRPRSYTVEVLFVDRQGRTTSSATAAVADVAAGRVRTFRATTTVRVTAASDCEVGRVTVLD